MAFALTMRTGTDQEHTGFITGKKGELTVVTDSENRNTAVVHQGDEKEGIRLARADLANVNTDGFVAVQDDVTAGMYARFDGNSWKAWQPRIEMEKVPIGEPAGLFHPSTGTLTRMRDTGIPVPVNDDFKVEIDHDGLRGLELHVDMERVNELDDGPNDVEYADPVHQEKYLLKLFDLSGTTVALGTSNFNGTRSVTAYASYNNNPITDKLSFYRRSFRIV